MTDVYLSKWLGISSALMENLMGNNTESVLLHIICHIRFTTVLNTILLYIIDRYHILFYQNVGAHII